MIKNLKQKLYKFYRKILVLLFITVGKAFIRLLSWTCRIEVIDLEKFMSVAEQGRCILMLWHQGICIVPLLAKFVPPHLIFTSFVSKSRDGELLAALARTYRQAKTIRVPHNLRHEALRQLIHQLKDTNEVMIITPDGPRGPLHVVKAGIAFAAVETSANVIPLNWKADRYWELKTWDKMRIPKPFSKITVYGTVLSFRKEDNMSVPEAQKVLQDAMLKLTF